MTAPSNPPAARPIAIPVPANLQPFVQALGADLTVEFLLEFGGGELYLAARPTERSQLVAYLGREKALALLAVSDRLPRRVPLAKPWLAKMLKARGLSVEQITRRLRTSDRTVRRYLETAAPSQLDLF